jgi:hypothetical protein
LAGKSLANLFQDVPHQCIRDIRPGLAQVLDDGRRSDSPRGLGATDDAKRADVCPGIENDSSIPRGHMRRKPNRGSAWRVRTVDQTVVMVNLGRKPLLLRPYQRTIPLIADAVLAPPLAPA